MKRNSVDSKHPVHMKVLYYSPECHKLVRWLLRRPMKHEAWADMGNRPMVLQQRNLRDQHIIGWYKLGSLIWACGFLACQNLLKSSGSNLVEVTPWPRAREVGLNLQNTFGCFFPISDAEKNPSIPQCQPLLIPLAIFLHFSCRISIGGEIYGEKAVSKARSCLVECVFLVPSKSQRFVDVHSNVTTRCEG